MRIGLLGPLVLEGGVGKIGPRDRVVLAALAVRPGEVNSAERLADVLWGDRPPASSKKVVQGCVARLRKLLGPETIETLPQGYRLSVSSDELDTLHFERLIGRGRELLTVGETERASYVLGQALDLWRGPAFADLDRWEPGRVEAGRLHELRLDSEELRLDASLQAGHHLEMLTEAQDQVAAAPLRERRWGLLALAQYQAGRQAEALRTLHRVRTVLANELGIDPSPDLVALEQAILQQDPSLLVEPARQEPSAVCPYRGLMAYDVDDSDTYFGREADLTACLERLSDVGVLAVVGPSGSGKSSLVRSGLIPALESGFMSGAGSSWRIAMLRPGEDPIGHLAAALDSSSVLGGNSELGETNRVLLEVTLRRSTLGLAEAVREARLPPDDNVLVIVDQFEELFRFRQSRQISNSRDEAIAFVKVLLEATAQQNRAIYVVLTMRSDFIGDCMDFPGLPDAVNAGLYLVGRMSRDGLRAAITGPVAVAGGTIAPRLVNRVLNELGDDHDQLPLVQHALMRTWDHWAARQSDGPIDIADYEAIGTFRDALSQHAEEAYEEAVALDLGHATERIFKALTDTFTDARGVRRPTAVSELAAIAEMTEERVIEAVEIFRRPGRCFLMPPAAIPLAGRSIIDLSHESLMRCWGRLIDWAEQERAAAAFY
ncbi:MAG: BTAD domain-containing putative transcriptional regulator, partial [Burkholderiales bacterium]